VRESAAGTAAATDARVRERKTDFLCAYVFHIALESRSREEEGERERREEGEEEERRGRGREKGEEEERKRRGEEAVNPFGCYFSAVSSLRLSQSVQKAPEGQPQHPIELLVLITSHILFTKVSPWQNIIL